MHTVHHRFHPSVISKTWVDDVNQRAEGLRDEVLGNLVGAGLMFATLVKHANMVISHKSVIIASDMSLACSVKRKFEAVGIPIRVMCSAADLGIDRGKVTGSKPKHSGRMATAGRRFKRISRIARSCRRLHGVTRKLATMGALPQMTYSMKAFGCPPTTMKVIRSRLGASLGPSKAGRCLTTFLSLELGDKDPMYSITLKPP